MLTAATTLKELDFVHLTKPLTVPTEIELSTMCRVVAIKAGVVTLGVVMRPTDVNNRLSQKCDTAYGYILHVNRSQIQWSSGDKDWFLVE